MKPKRFCVYELIDRLFWIVLMLMPFIMYVVHIHHAEAPMTFSAFFGQNLGVELATDSIIYTAFEKIFTVGNGFFDLFADMGIAIQVCVWFFFIEFLHVMFDILLFIPRWCHEMMSAHAYRR